MEIPPRIVSDGKNLLLNSKTAGDEPYMLASNLPDVAVLVDKDRVKSGLYAVEEYHTDTLILDDGFQYLNLKEVFSHIQNFYNRKKHSIIQQVFLLCLL